MRITKNNPKMKFIFLIVSSFSLLTHLPVLATLQLHFTGDVT